MSRDQRHRFARRKPSLDMITQSWVALAMFVVLFSLPAPAFALNVIGGATADVSGPYSTTAAGGAGYGFYLSNGTINTTGNVDISTKGSGAHGVYFDTGGGTFNINNPTTIKTTGDDAWGITAPASGINTIINITAPTTIIASGTVSAPGFGGGISLTGGKLTASSTGALNINASNASSGHALELLSGAQATLSGGGTITANTTGVAIDVIGVGSSLTGENLAIDNQGLGSAMAANLGATVSLNGGTLSGGSESNTVSIMGSSTAPVSVTLTNLSVTTRMDTDDGQAAAVSVYYLGGNVTADHVTLTTSTDSGEGLVAIDGGKATITNSTIITYGNNSGVPGTAGAGAAGIRAYDVDSTTHTPSTIQASNVSITTNGAGSSGLESDRGGVITFNGGSITTNDPAAHGILTSAIAATTVGQITVTNASLTAAGDAIASTGGTSTISLTNVTATAESGIVFDVAANGLIPADTTLTADSSTLTGAMLTQAGSTSTVNLLNGTTWNMTGDSNLTNLTNSASTIKFSAPIGDSTLLSSYRTLTTGSYVGNGGAIALNTYLGGDNSPSDKLVINGGTATGMTALRINNTGGAGVLTAASGILLVEATNNASTQAGAFALNSRVVAGPYEYNLFQGGLNGNDPQSWYLRSQLLPEPPSPAAPQSLPAPPVPQSPPAPLYRPEVGAYLANQHMTSGWLVHSLHDRLGEPQWLQQQQFSNDDKDRDAIWLRLVGETIGSQSEHGEFDTDSDEYLVQAGGDIAQWSIFGKNDRLHLGAMAGYNWGASSATAQGNPAKSDGDAQGVSIGAYGTWYQNNDTLLGWYTDLWGQYGWFTNHVRGDSLPEVRYNSQALVLSVEAGYAKNGWLPSAWIIEPQAQLIYAHGDQDDVLEQNGTSVTGGDGDGWISRLGVRLHRTWKNDSGAHTQPYLTLNWWHDATNNIIDFNQISMSDLYPRDRYEIKLGLNSDRGDGWAGWANIGGQWGSQDYHAYIGRIGIKYSW